MKRAIGILGIVTIGLGAGAVEAQTVLPDPLRYSVSTPRPINPAEGTTNPSARTTQSQNPYLGSVPAEPTGATIQLSLQAAIQRGLQYNLGLIETDHAATDVRTERLRALSSLLPQIEARARQGFEILSFKEIGLKLPPIPGVGALPPTTGGFGYQDTRVALNQNLFNANLRSQYQASKAAEQASILNTKDSRDVVVLAVGTAYLQVLASAAKLETAKAQLTSAQSLDQQTASRVKSEVSPEIDSLRSQVERQSAQQRLTNATNQLEKDKLTLGRITGLPVGQSFVLTDSLAYHQPTAIDSDAATEDAIRSRSDLASAQAAVKAAELTLRAQKAQRLPVISVNADYGGGGSNFGNYNQLYSIHGDVTLPIYTGGRIRADIEQASADLERKRAEYADLKGRIAYDVRLAWLDLTASDSSVKVAERNRQLAERALAQSQDRYANGVANYLEVVTAQETLALAGDNYVDSLYSLNTAMVYLARAMGGADTRIQQFLEGK